MPNVSKGKVQSTKLGLKLTICCTRSIFNDVPLDLINQNYTAMKRTVLNSIASLLFIAAVTACSSESAVDLTNDTTDVTTQEPDRQNRSAAWDGIIGIDRGNDVYEITADKHELLADLQATYREEGGTGELETLEIVKKTALNDAYDNGYLLISGDGKGVAIGVMLVREESTGVLKPDYTFTSPGGGPSFKGVSCWGCATGCNLEYLLIDGKKVPICNENGCVADCTRKISNVK